MAEKLTDSLCSWFGFTSFRKGQLDAIESLLARRHTLVVMPTGSGKSLIYQMAALQLPGLTVVVSPLIALMKDQVDGLNSLAIPATYINSTLSSQEQNRRLQAMSKGSFRLVYVAPERLRSVPFMEALSLVDVSLLAVDEAHCVSQWGHDFRPDYLHIGAARHQMNDILTVALTATATPEVQAEIITRLDLSSAHSVVSGFNRPNLTFEVAYAGGQESKLRSLRGLLGDLDHEAAIIYAGTRREAEEVAEFVETVAGIKARFYHGGLNGEQRAAVQDAFMSRDLPVVVATNAFGMGIDRPDVRLVTHFNVPGTLDAYYQEAGRAGRDGQPARAVLLYSPEDRALQEWFIANDAPSLEDVRGLHTSLQGIASPKARMSTQDLSLLTGLPEVKVSVALAQLEQAGAVERLGDERGRMSLCCGEWDEDALKAASDRVESRRRHRKAQLEHMVNYAESSSCRRRIMLAYFGDRGNAEAETCCDNCLAQRKGSVPERPRGTATLSDSERTALVILDSVRRLDWDVGRGKLGQMLRGSRAKDMQRMGYDKSEYYGRLAAFRAKEIESMIDQLVSLGNLKIVGGAFPVLRLAPQGRIALKSRASVSLRLPRRVSTKAVALAEAERKAGGTVDLTERLFLDGLTPAEIAAHRGLTKKTIYNHLADLIGRRRIPLSEVVSEEVIAQIRAAIDRLGDSTYLRPIKDVVPEDVSYEEIKCVVADIRREQQGLVNPSTLSSSDRTTRAVELGNRRSPEGIAELIAFLKDANGNVRRLAASALGKIGDRRAVQPLLDQLATEKKPQVRHYAVKALGVLGDSGACGLLKRIESDETERDYTRASARAALDRSNHQSAGPVMADEGTEDEDPIVAFLTRSHPRQLTGSWETGWALDFHSRFSGAKWQRSQVGELTYRLKYEGDLSVLPALVEQASALCAACPELVVVEALIPVPPSEQRAADPVRAVADALGERLGLPVWSGVLVKTRPTVPQKEMHTLAQKRANVAGAFAVSRQVRDRRLLVVDDLFDSGSTLEEVGRVLQRAGVARLFVLTLTRTIHAEA